MSHDVGYSEDSFGEIVGRIRQVMEREIESASSPVPGAATEPAAAPASAPDAPPTAT